MKTFTYSILIGSAFLLTNACLPGSHKPENSRERGSYSASFFSRNQAEKIKLRDGTAIVGKDYKLDETIRKNLESFLDSPQDLYRKPRESKEMSEAVKQGLSWPEALGIYHYTRGGYRDFSAYFGGGSFDWGNGRLTEEQVGWLILATVSGLNKLPVHQGTVYFGASLVLNDFLPVLEAGKPFSHKNFTSTSIDKATAETFATKELQRGTGSFLFTIENSKTGKNIERCSYWNEKEILFPPFHPFRVKEIKKAGEIKSGSESIPRYEVVLEDNP